MARRIKRRRLRTQWTHLPLSFWKKSKRARRRSRKLCKLLFMRHQSEEWGGRRSREIQVFGAYCIAFASYSISYYVLLEKISVVIVSLYSSLLVSARTKWYDMERKLYVSLFFTIPTSESRPTKLEFYCSFLHWLFLVENLCFSSSSLFIDSDYYNIVWKNIS